MDVEFNRLKEIRSDVCNTTLVWLAWMFLPALAISLSRVLDGRWLPVMGVQIVLVVSIGIAAFSRQHLPYAVRASTVVAAMFIIGIGAYLTQGGPSGLVFFISANIMVAVFWGERAGVASIVFSLIFVVGVFIAFSRGIIPIPVPSLFGLIATNAAGAIIASVGPLIAISRFRANLDQDRIRAETLKRAAESERTEIQTLLGAIVSSSDDAMISTTLDAIVTTWNKGAERIFGYSAEEMVGHPIAVLAVPGRENDMVEVLDRIKRGERVEHYETQRRRKDGALVDISLTVSAIHDADGRVVGASKIARDITKVKKDEERQVKLAAQLQQAQKMEAIGQLTGGLAHDFNNLLGVVLGNLDILQESQVTGSDEHSLTDAAIHAAVRGAELTKQLLAFARKQPLAPKLIDLNRVLDEAGRLLKRTLGEHITLEHKVADTLWPVLIDASQLESAILNLAVNARDAMADGGKLTLEAKNIALDDGNVELNAETTPGDYVVIAISDTGTGMPPDVVAKVFEPFFSTKGNKGTGLGLSMVYGFVKQSGGQTKIYSEPGRGTTIRMYLPRAVRGEPDVEVRHAGKAGHAKNGEVILVVEDNKGLRDLALRQLQGLGYRTLPAPDGAGALEILQGGATIDLMFTDMVMPGGMDGRALAASARRLRPSLKVLFTSGFTPAAASAAMNDEFGVNLLSKPYRKDELERRIRAAIDSP